jgi:hypothetical protein
MNQVDFLINYKLLIGWKNFLKVGVKRTDTVIAEA